MGIFAGAGDYEGFPGDGDSDEDGLDSAHETESKYRINDLLIIVDGLEMDIMMKDQYNY